MDTEGNRRRLRIVGRSAELQPATSPPFVAGPSAELTAEVIAAAVQSVTMVTLTWWAVHGQIAPEQLVDQALRGLESGFSHGKTPP